MFCMESVLIVNKEIPQPAISGQMKITELETGRSFSFSGRIQIEKTSNVNPDNVPLFYVNEGDYFPEIKKIDGIKRCHVSFIIG